MSKAENLNSDKIRAMGTDRIVELQKQYRNDMVHTLMDVYSERGKNRASKQVIKKNLARLATIKKEKEVAPK